MENFTGKFLWNSNLLEKITGGKSSGYWECDGIEIDSRKVKEGDLFLALSGQKLDGHNFVEDSILAGASAVMIKNDYTKNYKKFQNITVTDVFQSLIHIAQEARMRAEKLYKTKFIAITGSSGKTSTKEMMKIVLGKIGNTYANPESFNNHVGVRHKLSVNNGLRLSALIEPLVDVNSFHNLGSTISNRTLPAVAHSEDGVIMAVEHFEKNIFGIMWHFERENPFKVEDQDLVSYLFR